MAKSILKDDADDIKLEQELIERIKAEGRIQASLENMQDEKAEEALEDIEAIMAHGRIAAGEERLRERGDYATGGSLLADDMSTIIIEEETPIEEVEEIEQQVSEEPEEEQLPDEEMEDNYIDFIIDEALNEEEEALLTEQLESNPELSFIFDKVLEVATEFAGSGPIEGPGSGVSDSIPARLSDGEFVFTAKATEEIGADNLQRMMEDAETTVDNRLTAAEGGEIREEDVVEYKVGDKPTMQQDIRVVKETVGATAGMQEQDDLVSEEIKKRMLDPTRNYVRS